MKTMGDDLISRKALKQTFFKDNRNTYGLEEIAEIIDNQITAYDVDKVVERLDNYLFEKHCIEGDGEIVKILEGGGVDE